MGGMLGWLMGLMFGAGLGFVAAGAMAAGKVTELERRYALAESEVRVQRIAVDRLAAALKQIIRAERLAPSRAGREVVKLASGALKPA